MITAKDLYLTYDSNKYIIKRGNFSIKEKGVCLYWRKFRSGKINTFEIFLW